ncbi:ATP-binding protein [Microseira wollei]|uniref:histidine kinase n=1 Tax=Microseira wollei NIES-4236 TaxID=2530354 RepID=A0AAV3X747_9CYAN|nr:ATP-binding protein [Microseira wollei]GET37968.1 two-component sensor histidine kinase [Microseira wollei NIES-4236]
MDWVGDGCLINPDRWVECSETEQESFFERKMHMERTNPKPQIEQMDAIPAKTIVLPTLAATEANSCFSELGLDSTLQELNLYEVCIESDRPTNEVTKILNENPLLPGVIITSEGEYVGMISRRRTFEYLSRPYSLELFAKRPLKVLYGLAKTEILTLSSDTEIVAAARQSLQRQPELIYEPIVVQDPHGVYSLLDVHQLLLAQCQIQDAVAVALRQAEAKYRNIFENGIDGIFQTTPDGSFKSANPAMAQILGYKSPAELINNCTDIARQVYINQNRRAEFIAAMQEYGSVSAFESPVYRLDGSVIWIRENARAVRDESGNLLYYEGTVEDITEKKQAEEALRQREAQLSQKTTELETALRELQQTQAQLIQSEKMSSIGQMVAGVAHEINNPINCVASNLPHAEQYIQDLLKLVQLYAQHYPDPLEDEKTAIDLEFIIEDLPKILSAMQQGSDRIREIARSLRNFSRLDEAQMKPANIHDGIESTLLILHHRLKPKPEFPGIQIVKEYGNLPLVECYAGQLNQVFMNLIGNGIDAIEEVIGNGIPRQIQGTKGNENETTNSPLPIPNYQLPTIRISTEVINSDWVRIRISDNGVGMTAEVQEQLFNPFFTTKSTGKGTGLGLSISYQIVVEKHKGHLKCISAPGKGSEFIIEIPIFQKD